MFIFCNLNLNHVIRRSETAKYIMNFLSVVFIILSLVRSSKLPDIYFNNTCFKGTSFHTDLIVVFTTFFPNEKQNSLIESNNGKTGIGICFLKSS